MSTGGRPDISHYLGIGGCYGGIGKSGDGIGGFRDGIGKSGDGIGGFRDGIGKSGDGIGGFRDGIGGFLNCLMYWLYHCWGLAFKINSERIYLKVPSHRY